MGRTSAALGLYSGRGTTIVEAREDGIGPFDANQEEAL
jgi:hypothetical protein